MDANPDQGDPKMSAQALLAVDIGGGTQDLLVWNPKERIENCVKLVLPSPTRVAASRIRRATDRGLPVFLHGQEMGGGANTAALKAHLAKGLAAYSTTAAAHTFYDNLEYVRDMGVVLAEEPPEGAVPILLTDLELDGVLRLLREHEVEIPHRIAVAVQDHGYSPTASNREARFSQWRTFLSSGGRLRNLLFGDLPEQNRRMAAVRRVHPDALIMDTGPAAILGALLDDWAVSRIQDGLLVVNAGNAHTLAYLVAGDRCYGIYEHHTGCLDSVKIRDHLARFREGTLPHDEIFGDEGHGVAYTGDAGRSFSAAPLLVTGPQRFLLLAEGGRMAAPFGDMMLSGCFGLVQSVLNLWGEGLTLTAP